MDHVNVVIRPLVPADRERYLEAFARMSPRTRYLRFAMQKDSLSRTEADYFLGVDGVRHVAYVAVAGGSDRIVGVARYVRSASRPDTAEAAIVVGDAWQHHGVGAALLERLVAHARADGLHGLEANTLAENTGARALLRRSGFAYAGGAGRDAAFRRAI